MSGLAFGFMAFPFVVALILGLALPLLVAAAYRSMSVGAVLLTLALGLTAAFPGLTRGGLQLGVRLDLLDLVAMVLIVVTLLRGLLAAESLSAGWPFYVFAGVVGVNVVHGLFVYGAAAGAAARPEVYALTAAAYASTFRADARNLRVLTRTLIFATCLLAALTIFRWVAVAFDIRDLLPPSGSFQPRGHSVWRVIVSSETLLLAEFALLSWLFSRPGQTLRGWQWSAPLLLLMVAVLQHRSTWLALGAGSVAAILAARHAGLAGRRGGAFVALLGGIVLAVALLAGRSDGLGSDVAQSASDAIALRGTAAERLDSWQQLVSKWVGGGPRTLLIGSPEGTSNERFNSDDLGARKISYQAHNYYVTVLTTHGALGFVAFMAMFAGALRGLVGALKDDRSAEPAAILIALIVAQAAYYLTYGVDYMQFFILGVALSFVGQRRRQRQSEPRAIRVRPFRPRTFGQ